MIEINCVICGKKISHPRVDQLCCNRKKCKEEFNLNQLDLFNHLNGGNNEIQNKN